MLRADFPVDSSGAAQFSPHLLILPMVNYFFLDGRPTGHSENA
jgi:hypothetical protein